MKEIQANHSAKEWKPTAPVLSQPTSNIRTRTAKEEQFDKVNDIIKLILIDKPDSLDFSRVGEAICHYLGYI